jgi:hypothetical protein
MDDKILEEILKPIPFKHEESNIFSACGIEKNRSKGVMWYLDKLSQRKKGKHSEVIEFIEQAMDLTRREQLVFAFSIGRKARED